jgi:aminomethyltransferase
LHERHVAAGAKFSEFGGWLMPLQYAGVVSEHRAVRERVGVFDVSHLGKALVEGPGALDFLNRCLSNDLARIGDGQAQYTLLCDESGGVVDDMIAYRFSPQRVLLIPNAANNETVVGLLRDAAPAGVEVANRHEDLAVIAVQGPYSDETLAALALPVDHPYMGFAVARFGGAELTVCRTGYTGERGYELVVPNQAAGEVWDAVLAAGREYDAVPAGLGARDTLRTEQGYALHGHELSPQISPVQAGVSWAVGWKKDAFWGADALRAERSAGPKRRSRGLRAVGRAIPRPGMAVVGANETPLGEVTSGTFSPTLNTGIALALLDAAVEPGARVGVRIRSRVEEFEVVEPPFVPSRVKDASDQP